MADPGDDTPDRIRLVVLFGGRSAEHEVSCISAFHVLRAVDPERYSVDPIGITRDGDWVRAEGAIAALHAGAGALPATASGLEALEAVGAAVEPLPAVLPAAPEDVPVVVFPILHGPQGEDGTVQGLLEMAGVPFVGSGVLASALCMDKLKAKEVVAAAGIDQARWVGLRTTELDDARDRIAEAGLPYPLFVKPANLGSSIGVVRVATPDDLADALATAAAYDEWIVVEEGIAGRELEIAVLGNEAPRASVPGEVIPGREFYDYEDKYLEDSARIVIPADVPEAVAEEMADLAVRAFTALRCDGMARVDFFLEEGGRGLLLNEVNTIPGFTPISQYPKLWEASGLSYAELVDELVGLALQRHTRRSRFSLKR